MWPSPPSLFKLCVNTIAEDVKYRARGDVKRYFGKVPFPPTLLYHIYDKVHEITYVSALIQFVEVRDSCYRLDGYICLRCKRFFSENDGYYRTSHALFIGCIERTLLEKKLRRCMECDDSFAFYQIKTCQCIRGDIGHDYNKSTVCKRCTCYNTVERWFDYSVTFSDLY